jgi:ribulose-phosphate 3-epimerase
VRVAPSLIAADFTRFQEEIKDIEHAGADLLHLDVMDGVFVPNITFGPMIVKAVDSLTTMELEAHLMIVKPEKYLRQFIDAGSNWVSIHTEATEKTKECIDYIHERKKKAGLALNPPTHFKEIKPFIDTIDYVLIMAVHPGFYGQQFIPDVLKKIEETKNWVITHRLRCVIMVDGGINASNVGQVEQAGADIVVAGAGVFKTQDYRNAIQQLRCLKD